MASTGWPAMTMAEIRRAFEDENTGRHWCGPRCWCREVHDPGTAGLVSPPWEVPGNA